MNRVRDAHNPHVHLFPDALMDLEDWVSVPSPGFGDHGSHHLMKQPGNS